MNRFTVVDGGTVPNTEIHDAMRAALNAALADGAVALMLTYETAKGYGHSCVPALSCVREGFVTQIVRDAMADLE